MADTYQSYSNAGQTTFSVPFPYLNKSHVKVTKGRDIVLDTQTATLAETSGYTFNTSGTQITLTSALGSGEVLTIERQTPSASQLSPWSDGSNLTAEELNNADLQNLYIVQEQKDRNSLGASEARNATTASDTATATANAAQATANAALARSGGTMTGDIAMGGNRISGLPSPSGGSEPVIKSYFESQSWNNTTETIVSIESWPGSNAYIATTGAIDGRIDSKIDTAIEGDVLAGTDLTKTQTGGQVTINHSVTGASSVNNSNSVVLQDLTINPRGHITGHASIDLDTIYYTETELDAGQLDNRYYTETELLTNGVLDTRYFTQTAADARYYNLSSGEEIQSGETWAAADNKIATTAAIDARIVDLVEEVGGFVPIANETSFPTANPDINNGTGTLVSVQVLAGSHTPSGGTVTIANGAGSGNTVTITGCGSTSLPAGFGVIVSTTSTLHTYVFHRLTPKATEVTTVAGNNTNITTVATNIANITTVADDLNETTSEIDTVANAIANVNTVGNAIANVNTTATNIANINTVASDLNETTSEIDTVATNIANVNTVGTSIANVNTVANDLNETTSEIDTVATNIANVNTVGNAITNVNNVGGSITNVNTVATNLADVSNFADRYQIASSDPSTRADSSSLQEGDQYYNTTANVLKVYDGSNWNTGVTDTTGFAVSTGQTFTGNVGVPAASNSAPGIFIAGDTDTGIYSPGANLLAITASGTKVLEAGSSGIEVTGSVTATSFSGNLNASQLNTGTVPTARLGSGSSVSTKFLRGDNTWQTINSTPEGTAILSTGISSTYYYLRPDGDGTCSWAAFPSYLLTGGGTITGDLVFDGQGNGGDMVWCRATYQGLQDVLNFRDGSTASFGTTHDLRIFHSHSDQINYLHAPDGSIQIKADTFYLVSDDTNGRAIYLDNANSRLELGFDGNHDAYFTGNGVTFLKDVTIHSYELSQSGSNTQNLKVRGYAAGGQTDVGISGYNNADAWCFQLYGQPGYYGFLDGNWGGWDLRKTANGELEVDAGSGLKTVAHQGNVGSGGVFSNVSVFTNKLYANNTGTSIHAYGWQYFESTTAGLYWNNGSAHGFHIHPGSNANMVLRSGNSGSVSWQLQTAGTTRGYFYADNGSHVGILNNSGSWIIRGNSDTTTTFFNSLYPSSNNSYNFGSTSYKWASVHATTYYGDGSNLTGISSAPETAMTASGSVSQGKPLVVNSSGQVEQITETVTALSTLPQAHLNIPVDTDNHGSHYGWDGIWEPISQRLVVGGRRNYGGRWRFKVRVHKFTDQLTVTSAANSATNPAEQRNMYLPNNASTYGTETAQNNMVFAHNGQGTIVTAFQYKTDDVNSYPKLMGACAMTITQTAKSGYPTYGTIVNSSGTFTNDNHRPKIVYIGNNKFACTWSNYTYSNGSWGSRSAILTLSGTNTLSWGSEVDCNANVGQTTDLCWDSTNNKLVFLYGSIDSSSNYHLKCKLGTVSGTSISWSSETTVSTSYYNEPNRSALSHDPSTGRVVASWISGGSTRYPKVRVLDCSGSTPSMGTELFIQGSSNAVYSNTMMTSYYDALTQKLHVIYQDYQSKGASFQMTTNTSNTNLTIGSRMIIENFGVSNWPSVAIPIPDYAMAGVLSNYDGTYPRIHYYKTATRTSQLSTMPVLGFAKNSASNGGSVTVQLNGNVQENQSGLTPGKQYYIGADGNVNLAPAGFYSIDTTAGISLSSTKLAINIG